MNLASFAIAGAIRMKNQMSTALNGAASGIGKFTKVSQSHINRLNKRIGSTHRLLAKTARIALVSGTIAAAGLGLIAKAGIDFEQAITDVGAVGLQTRDQIKELESEALRLGATTKFTATESANAMEVMARSGFKNQEILAGVGGVLDAAAASGLEMAEVAGHVSSALKGFGLDASNATHVADVLALASSKTKSTIGTLGESIANVASTARELRVPFEDAVAGVALLQDVGLDASVAGSALNTMLTKLAKPPAEVAKQMKKFGVSFKDAAGNMLPFDMVLGNISKAAEKSGGNMDRVAFLADLVGLRGQKAASNLAMLFESGKLTELTEGLYDAAGAAKKMADLRMDTLRGDITLLGSAVDGVEIALFDLKGGALRGVVQGMTEWIGKNKELIVSNVQGFISSVRDNLSGIVRWMKIIGVGLGVFYALATAAKVASVAMEVFNFVATLSPFGMIAIAVVALGALLYAFWPEISDGAKRAWDAITGFVKSAWEGIKGFIAGVGEFIVGVFEALFPGVTASTIALIGWIKDAWSVFGAWVGELWDGITDKASKWASSISGALAPLGEFFADLWQGIADTFTSTVGWLFDAISSAVSDVRAIGESALGGGDVGALPPDQTSSMPTQARVVSPAEQQATYATYSYSESNSSQNYSSELTIRDETGRASITKRPKGGAKINMVPTGAY